MLHITVTAVVGPQISPVGSAGLRLAKLSGLGGGGALGGPLLMLA
jgi:hypothetical protein